MPTRLDGPLTMRRPLLISHDLSYSGAPIALLELATSLKRLGESPLVLTVRGGPLTERFRSAGIELPHAIDPRDISFVMANTILAVQPALKFKQFGIPIAAWLHESRYFFEQFRVSPTQVRLADLDVVLTPSMFQMGEFADLSSAWGYLSAAKHGAATLVSPRRHLSNASRLRPMGAAQGADPARPTGRGVEDLLPIPVHRDVGPATRRC